MTDKNQSSWPDLDQDYVLAARGRPAVAGPFGPLATDISLRVHPELADAIRMEAAQIGMDMSEYLRDVIYRHWTGKTYSRHVSDAADAREKAMFGEASERAANVDVVRAMRAAGGAR